MQASLEWVDINKILPNPLNPRRDHSVKSKEMQDIINSKGWEEGITCYKNREFYIILSGHRRWYAAKTMGTQQVPVFIVESPKNEAEELERLGSVQGGQVDWNPYEWAKYTYDMWKNLNEISYSELSKKLGVTQGLISARIRVYQYYPRIEIEDKLENGMYSITMLYYINLWINKLKKYNKDVVDAMGEDFIRKQLLKKYENKCFNSQIVNDKIFVNSANSQKIIDFLSDINKNLSDCQMEISSKIQVKNSDIIQNSLEINATISDIKKIKCRTKKEAEKLIDELNKLLTVVSDKSNFINKQIDLK
ncbi:ParB/RepB/Spo0J family partition protein [Psychrobacillus sp. NPDC096426]|uniref:ParB/RepB/Spo0J family partition protein n=1 Tax=Psychrobacillus sp. NPDC096426 TaxID=3364491 RepID=UPI00382373D4